MRQQIRCGKGAVWFAALVGVIAAAPGGSVAQQAAGVTSSAAPVASPAGPAGMPSDVTGLAEEITVLQAVKPLKPTPDQLAAMTPAVTQAQDRLAQQAQADLHALAALREPTTRARQQLFTEGANLDDPHLGPALMADQAVTNAQRAAEQNQTRLRGELAAGLRQQLEKLLTPAQIAGIVAQGRAILSAQRAQQDQQRAQRLQQMRQAAASRGAVPAGPGAGGPRGGGPWGPGGPGSMRLLDRLHGMNPDQYERMSQRIASRFGDVGTPAYDDALAMMDQIHSMPDDQFQQQRGTLAQQFGAGMASAQASNSAEAISDAHAMETWVDRYLLSPQAPAALKDLATAASESQGQG